MVKYSYMRPANADPSNYNLIQDIMNHSTEELPDVVPVWARYREPDKHFELNWTLFEALRRLKMEPVVYAETQPMKPEDILSGKHDDAFKLMAARSRGSAIRIFHEANGGLFPWGKWPKSQCMDCFGEVGSIFHEEGAKLIYCMVARGKRDDDLLDRYPGSSSVDIVAFDEFRRDDKEPFPPNHAQWRYTTGRLTTTGKPVWVCETGCEADTTERGRWMSSLDEVGGVDVIAVFDYRIEYEKPDGTKVVDDWRWNNSMIEQWDRLRR